MAMRGGMDGMLCAEFVQWAEGVLPEPVLQRLAREGARRGGGTGDLLAFLDRLAIQVGDPAALLRTFGIHLFGRLAARFPVFFVDAAGAVPFLVRLESHVLGEVRKLAPGASLPRLDPRAVDGGAVELTYRGGPWFAELAEGLVRGCLLHFDEPMDLVRTDEPGGDEVTVRFRIASAVRPAPDPTLALWGGEPA